MKSTLAIVILENPLTVSNEDVVAISENPNGIENMNRMKINIFLF